MLAIILFFLLSHREPWVLEYHCEASSQDFCSDGGHGAEKSFPSKQERLIGFRVITSIGRKPCGTATCVWLA